MNITINYGEQEYDMFLYNFQFWNQRFFCLGQSTDGTLFKKFISTKGFDYLLMESSDGPKFHFKKDHFNPYLCNKDKDVWHESQQIGQHYNTFNVNDIGPNEYSGNYIPVKELGEYRDDTYFETKSFVKPDFDLFQYQNDDLYFIQHQSINKDKLPCLTCLLDADLYGKINVIHGVTDKGDELFDLESLFKIVDTDLSYPEKNGLYQIAKRSNKDFILRPSKYGTLEFYKAKQLEFLTLDCGNAYIREVILHKAVKRKYALRYLYEYFNLTKQLTSTRRRTSAPIQVGPKEFKQSEFGIHFDVNDTAFFKIIYYTDVFTIERKSGLSALVPAQPENAINGKYDFINSRIEWDDFTDTKTMLNFIRETVSVTQSIKLAKLIGQWLSQNFGYAPRISKIPIAKKANAKPLVNTISIIHVPTYGSDGDIYETETYINLYEFLATYGIHISQIRNILQMDWFNTEIFRLLQTTFEIYHVSRDYRRSLFAWNNDIELRNCMVPMADAKRLISLFESAGDKKNSYWYNNANLLLTAFPDQLLQPAPFIQGD